MIENQKNNGIKGLLLPRLCITILINVLQKKLLFKILAWKNLNHEKLADMAQSSDSEDKQAANRQLDKQAAHRQLDKQAANGQMEKQAANRQLETDKLP